MRAVPLLTELLAAAKTTFLWIGVEKPLDTELPDPLMALARRRGAIPWLTLRVAEESGRLTLAVPLALDVENPADPRFRRADSVLEALLTLRLAETNALATLACVLAFETESDAAFSPRVTNSTPLPWLTLFAEAVMGRVTVDGALAGETDRAWDTKPRLASKVEIACETLLAAARSPRATSATTVDLDTESPAPLTLRVAEMALAD